MSGLIMGPSSLKPSGADRVAYNSEQSNTRAELFR